MVSLQATLLTYYAEYGRRRFELNTSEYCAVYFATNYLLLQQQNESNLKKYYLDLNMSNREKGVRILTLQGKI